MADDEPTHPFWHNDVDPFASQTHLLDKDGQGPQEVDVDLRDRDIAVRAQAGKGTIRMLHLQNVRTDTIAAAKAAIDDFLDQVKSADQSKDGAAEWEGSIMQEGSDPVHDDASDYLKAQAKSRGLRFKWYDGSFPRDPWRQTNNQPKYIVSLGEDGSPKLAFGTRFVSPWKGRAPPSGNTVA